MAQAIRVYKLAAEFGISKEQMVAKIQEFGFPVNNYFTTIEEDSAKRIRDLMQRERDERTVVEEKINSTVVRRKTTTPARPAKIKPPKLTDAERQLDAEAAVAQSQLAAVSPADESDVAQGAAVAPPSSPDEATAKPAATPKDERVFVPVQRRVATPPVRRERVPAQGGARTAMRDEEFVSGQSATRHDDGAAGDPAFYEEMTRKALAGSTPGDMEDDGKGAALRPSSEAPMIRRHAVPGSDDDRFVRGVPRTREIESRDVAPARRAGVVVPGAVTGGPARKRRMTPGAKGKKTEITTPKAIKRVIKIEGQITLLELAKRMGVKATELLMKLMGLGMAGVNINSTLDLDTAKIVAEEFGYEVESNVVEEVDMLADTRAEETDEERKQRVPRSPIVTMMGHVDHGKTSLLDYIRKANVADGEAGGITQHIGAYRVRTPIGEVTFIDTPGHAAFAAMRARGANATDIVVLLCAANDGVMPQTIEAIQHARAAECPIIVAINKCDLQDADPGRAKRMLMEHGLVPEELGGDTIMVELSAKTGKGVDQLLEMLSLQAEVMELDANPLRPGAGVVLEAYLDKGRGPVANILIKEGTLRVGDILVAGAAHGRVRAMTDERGRKTAEAGPATPVEVLGLSSVPAAGDVVDVVADMKLAEKVTSARDERVRASIAPSMRPSLETLYSQLQNEEQAELKVVVKTDVQGTMEALREALEKLSTEKVKITVVGASCGGITESDVLLASTAGAIILGFNVRPAGKARSLADEQGVEIKIYSIIYELLDAVKAAMLGLLTPTTEEEVIGMAEVRETYNIPKHGTIAGSYVTEGKVMRNGFARLIRDSVQIWEGKVSSLRRFKDDVKEVVAGLECGIGLAGYNDIRVGDVVEFYLEKEVAATLE